MGEDTKWPRKKPIRAIDAMVVDTLGGCVQAFWYQESAATLFLKISTRMRDSRCVDSEMRG